MAKKKTTEELLEDISNKLDRLLYALAINAVKGKIQKYKIIDLFILGYKPREIATILRTTSNVVSVTISNFKKDRKKEESNAKEKERH